MITSNPYFDTLCEQYGPFYATMKIAKEARKVCEELPGRIDFSTAIDYIANEKLISPEDFPDHRLDTAKEYLSYILDQEVVEAVLASYQSSLDYDSLVYRYLNIDDDHRMTRVRILTNMIWSRRPNS
jgi:hypothetical protein